MDTGGELKLFAGAFMAEKKDRNGIWFDVILFCTAKAVSEEEAIGRGIKHALARYPRELGWVNHRASAMQVPPKMIAEVCEAQDGPQ